MDRYITKQKRINLNQPENLVGNQMIAFSPTTGNNITMNEPNPGLQYPGGSMRNVNVNPGNSTFNMNKNSNVSGIDPKYLASNADGASYMPGIRSSKWAKNPQTISRNENLPVQHKINIVNTKTREPSPAAIAMENQLQSKTRSELRKELFKHGPRVFSGQVEKVLKWHKSLQDIGVLILYEIVAKCVNVRAGESCAKNLVVRDENGPAMQVVYYEIDFLMPEIKPPCTIRVIGRMLAGTNLLHAFNVRLATSDDVATLPRRTAVAAHYVAKLCKEYAG